MSLFLNVPYTEKDDAKKLGACWDPTRKQKRRYLIRYPS